MPLRYRHLGFCLSISCQWIFAFVTVFAGPIAVERGGNHGWTTWIWFLVFNVISVPFGEKQPVTAPILASTFTEDLQD